MIHSTRGKLNVGLTVGYMLLILATSLIPTEPGDRQSTFVPDLSPDLQNLLHIPMYGVLSILLLRVFSDTAHKHQNVTRLVLIICIAFGMTNELIQGFVPGRFAGLLDVGLNVIGAVAGLLCGRLFIHKFGHQQN